jgi:hypothetical protein
MATSKRTTRGRPAKTPTEESLDVARRLEAIIDQAERDGLAGTQTYVMLHKVMQEVLYKLMQGGRRRPMGPLSRARVGPLS